eukprot:TRINITY_DN6794_c0_g1_i3.p1 TRINITY_DN6794_c0_g1~~TRINITY_DN6794_c0_g1_i3.p1  ORF type:complete len:165 (-),score=44.91 TRINITY_DN6794_c0_g1_i3:66-560(-)
MRSPIKLDHTRNRSNFCKKKNQTLEQELDEFADRVHWTRKIKPRAIAIYDYAPQKSKDIGLQEGEIVTIYKMYDNGWWLGEANHCIGRFPSNFVELLEMTWIPVRALEHVDPIKEDDLELREGELIVVILQDDDWYGVKEDGSSGWFPANSVQEIELMTTDDPL